MAIAAMLALVGTSAAAAGDLEQVSADGAFVNTGGGVKGGPVVRTAAEEALHAQKRKLVAAWEAMRSGTLDVSTFEADYDAFMAKVGGAQRQAIVPMGYTDLILPLVQRPQAKSYYCGPAVAVEILDYLDDPGIYDVAGPNGESLSQAHVAAKCTKGYLCTDKETQTPWYYTSEYPHPMKSTINQWAGTQYYSVENDTSQWVSDLGFDIVHGYPIAANVNEWSGRGYHLVGHPTNANIGHWVAAHGFKDEGAITRYADSVHGTTFWSWSDDVPAHSDYNSARFEWLMSNNSKGYVG